MIEQDDQMNRPSALPIAWSLMMALAAGLLLGLLGSLLLGHLNWSGSLFLPLTSLLTLLLGMMGMLVVGPRKKRLMLRGPVLHGIGIGGLCWLGIWLAMLVWASFQPVTITDCSFPDGPCQPTAVPFWGEYAGIFLFVYFFFLIVGFVCVLVGGVVTRIVLDQRASRLESSL